MGNWSSKASVANFDDITAESVLINRPSTAYGDLINDKTPHHLYANVTVNSLIAPLKDISRVHWSPYIFNKEFSSNDNGSYVRDGDSKTYTVSYGISTIVSKIR